MSQKQNKWIIAGPCALESREQLRGCVTSLKALGIRMVRASLWKPRTQPGWEGLGGMSLPLLLEETLPHGLIPATEIMSAEHALMAIHALEHYGEEAQMIIWLGSRNQNHIEQRRSQKSWQRGQRELLSCSKTKCGMMNGIG